MAIIFMRQTAKAELETEIHLEILQWKQGHCCKVNKTSMSDQDKSIFVAAKQRRIKSQVLEEASWGSLPCYGESTLRSSFVSQGLITLFF